LLLNDDSFSGVLGRESGENVGNYALNLGTLSAGANYNISFVTADFYISTKDITVTIDANQTKVYGTSDPVFTFEVNPELIAGDLFSGLVEREAGENVGTYAIQIGTLSAGANYNMSFIGADFTITKASPVISWSNPENIYYGTMLSEIQLNATADITGIFNYEPGFGTILPVGNNQELNLRFISKDNTNYFNTSATVYINVLEPSGTNELKNTSISVSPNPSNGIFTISSDKTIESITIYNISGKIVFSKKISQAVTDVDLSDFAKGLYFIQINSEGSSNFEKIILK